MRHSSLVGNENYILIRFFATWKIPLPCLTLQGPFWGVLTGRLPLRLHLGDIIYLISAHEGWHMVRARGERVAMRQSRWPVVQGNEMHLNVTVQYNGRVEGLVCRWSRRRCREAVLENSYTSVHWKNLEGFTAKKKPKTNFKHTFSFTSSSIEPFNHCISMLI